MSVTKIPLFSLVLSGAASIACGADPSAADPSFADYDGPPAYPSRRPSLAGSGGDRVVITLDGDEIGVVDVASGQWLGPVPVGRNPIELDGPHAITAAPDGSFVYVALTYPDLDEDNSYGTSQEAGYVQKLDPLDLSPVGAMRVDADPAALLLSENGEQLAVTHYNLLRASKNTSKPNERRSTLSIMATKAIVETDTPEPTRLLVCSAPHGISASKVTQLLYVACRGEDALAIVDADALSVRRVPLGEERTPLEPPIFEPYEVSASPSGRILAVSSVGEQRSVAFFDVTSQSFQPDPVPVAGLPGKALWRDERTVLVPAQHDDGLLEIDVDGKTPRFRDLTQEGCTPIDLALSSDGQRVYVLCDDLGQGSALLTLALGDDGPAEVVAARPVPTARRMAVLAP